LPVQGLRKYRPISSQTYDPFTEEKGEGTKSLASFDLRHLYIF